MTIDEAIQHCHEVAKENRKTALEYARAYAWDTAHGCRECASEHEQLAAWLVELKESRECTRWIPCSERMPEQSGIYLAYYTYKDGTHAIDIAYINAGNDLGSITHWMPLPEPPKEVQEDA